MYFYSTRGHQHDIFPKKATGKSRKIPVQEVHLGLKYVINLGSSSFCLYQTTSKKLLTQISALEAGHFSEKKKILILY